MQEKVVGLEGHARRFGGLEMATRLLGAKMNEENLRVRRNIERTTHL